MTFQESGFGIRANAKGFRILSDNIYKDKIAAVVREYAHNARDAHIAAGCPDKPIRVKLPSRDDRTFMVSDDGIGMDDDTVKTVFTVFFESTKVRHSNEMVGQLGIGGKAAFGYTDKFTVVSRLNGTKSTYFMYIDARGEYKVSPPIRVATDAPNGIDVIVEARESDISKFVSAAETVFEYFRPYPEVVGNSSFKRLETDIEYEGEGYRLRREKLRNRASARAIMGMIAYPIDANVLDRNDFPRDLTTLARNCIDIDFELGSLDFMPGREDLNYDIVITLPSLRKRLEEIADSIRSRIDAEFAECKSSRQAHACMDAALSGRKFPWGEYSRTLVNIFGGRWNGHNIGVTGLVFEVPSGVNFVKFDDLGSRIVSDVYRHSARVNISPREEIEIFVNNDFKHDRALVRRYIANKSKKIGSVMLVEGEGSRVSELLKRFDGWKIRSIEELLEYKTVRPKNVSLKRLKYDAIVDSLSGTLRDAEVDLSETGYYVTLKHSRAVDENGKIDGKFQERYNALVKAGVFIPSQENLVFVPTTIAKEVVCNPNWIPFHREMIHRVRRKANDENTRKLIGLGNEWRTIIKDRGLNTTGIAWLRKFSPHLPEGHPISCFVKSLDELIEISFEANAMKELLDLYEVDTEVPSRGIIENAWSDILERYGVLEVLFDQYSYNTDYEAAVSRLVEYITLVDSVK